MSAAAAHVSMSAMAAGMRCTARLGGAWRHGRRVHSENGRSQHQPSLGPAPCTLLAPTLPAATGPQPSSIPSPAIPPPHPPPHPTTTTTTHPNLVPAALLPWSTQHTFHVELQLRLLLAAPNHEPADGTRVARQVCHAVHVVCRAHRERWVAVAQERGSSGCRGASPHMCRGAPPHMCRGAPAHTLHGQLAPAAPAHAPSPCIPCAARCRRSASSASHR